MLKKFFSGFLISSIILTSLCELQIFSPPNLSTVTSEDGGITICFLYWAASTSASGLILKVDVIGFADPSGWQHMHLNPLEIESSLTNGTERKVFRGSVKLWELSPGAVTIRLRALTADGTDATGEDTSRFFLDPKIFFQHLSESQSWVRRIADHQHAICCLSLDQRCFAAGLQAAFCEAFPPKKMSEQKGILSVPFARDDFLRPESGSSAIVALIDGFDYERLLPFVELLRESGYEGEIHLIAATPEITCDWEMSSSCIKLMRYLTHRNVVLHPFPDDIEYCRQHMRYHDYLLKLQIIGRFCTGDGKHFSSIIVVDASKVIFQENPFVRLLAKNGGGFMGLNALFLIGNEESDSDIQVEDGLNRCWSSAVTSGYGLVKQDLVGGSPGAILYHVSFQLIIAWQLISHGGLACAIPVWYHPPKHEQFPVYILVESANLLVNFKGPGDFCRIGLSRGEACGPVGLSRQHCLNLGCCFVAPMPWENKSYGDAGVTCVRPGAVAEDGRYRVEEGIVVSQTGPVAAVFGYRQNREIVQHVWARHASATERYFPGRKSRIVDRDRRSDLVDGGQQSEIREGGLPSVKAAQARVDDLVGRGTWVGDAWAHAEWAAKDGEELVTCLAGTDLHMFGDSRMRGLSFSLMHLLNASVEDGDEHLKQAVVPVEAQDLCGGNRRYENHVACGSLLGYALHLPAWDALVSFHELFHFDHGPTLAATISQLIASARRAVPRRRLVVVMAPGFHMVSSSPVEAGSMMGNFLPQIIDAVWDMHDGWELGYWMTMEPTSGGPGAWPELEHVNDVANRTVRLSAALVLLDSRPVAAPRPDLLVDGSHYAPAYRRVAAQLLLAPLCPP